MNEKKKKLTDLRKETKEKDKIISKMDNILQDAQGKKKSNENLLRFIEERQQNNQKNENDKKKWKSQRVGNER